MNNNHDARKKALYDWINNNENVVDIRLIPGDASTRRYFRVILSEGSLIAVDAPPDTENNVAFVSIAQTFLLHGLHVPRVLAADYNQGFLLLTDLGDTQLLKILNDRNVDQLYAVACQSLLTLQNCIEVSGWTLPLFDREFLLMELERFPKWFLTRHLGIELSQGERLMLNEMFDVLIHSAEHQPKVCVHRDFHSRNLMLLPNHTIGLLDFQDAAIGPITYDLVSLLRDCYIKWPSEKVYGWVEKFWKLLINDFRYQDLSLKTFCKWFDLMGVQRHLKVLGIFARLYLRDKKALYLQDIPRILSYVLDVCGKYPELAPLNEFFKKRVISHESYDFSCRSWLKDASTHG